MTSLYNIIDLVSHYGFKRDILPFLFTNRKFYNDTYLWSKIINLGFNKSNATVLMNSCLSNNISRFNFLINCKPDLNITDKNNRSAIFYTIFHESLYNDKTIFNKLLSLKPNLDIMDSKGKNILYYALMLKDSEMIRDLCKDKIKLEVVFHNTLTALSMACQMNNKEAVKILLEYGANVNSVKADGKNVITTAINSNADMEIIKDLLKYNADINLPEIRGRTAIYYGIACNNIEIVKLLIKHGADIFHQDYHGMTPCYYAKELNHKNILKILK